MALACAGYTTDAHAQASLLGAPLLESERNSAAEDLRGQTDQARGT
jgi:hypothetical protein